MTMKNIKTKNVVDNLHFRRSIFNGNNKNSGWERASLLVTDAILGKCFTCGAFNIQLLRIYL